MTELIVFAVIAVLLFASLLFLARERRESPNSPASAHLPPVEQWFPNHARYFPPILQAISEGDIAYLSTRITQASFRHARAERHRVVCDYLAGLREDFVQTERLARTLAGLSPAVVRRLEWERVRLGLQFRGLYGLAWLRIQTGMDCVEPLTHLTHLVADLATRVEALGLAMGRVSPQAAEWGSTAQGGGSRSA
jgi:hypothetical protein